VCRGNTAYSAKTVDRQSHLAQKPKLDYQRLDLVPGIRETIGSVCEESSLPGSLQLVEESRTALFAGREMVRHRLQFVDVERFGQER
jgi:hypothetical protein